MKPPRIAFYGNFGDGNLGNEVTLQTVIEHTRKRWPDAQFECICTGPTDVRTRHGISAFCSVAGGEAWTPPAESASSGAAGTGSAASAAPGRQSGLRGLVAAQRARKTLAFRLASLPVKVLRGLLVRLPRECIHWVRTLRVVARCDMLIIPGTGIVTDRGCGPWVWPYELFKCSAVAALCRVELVYLSVGAGPVDRPLSRWFITRGLAMARYRSYRDEDSKRYVAGMGFDSSRDAVYPDLVFGLTAQSLPSAGAEDARTKVVGLGLKNYSGSGDGNEDAGSRAYLEMMAAFVSWLGTRGYTVRLLIGDVQYDEQVRRDLLAKIESRIETERPCVVMQNVPTVSELTRQLAECDAIISPRLHNLILALMLEKPVIALSDLQKVKSLLDDLQLSEYCLPIDTLDAEGLRSGFLRLESQMAGLKTHIRGRVESYRQAVERQYAVVFGDSRLALGHGSLPSQGEAEEQ
jgi:polysaccharide pyruvyl transferase WcaK-like protein